MSADWELFKPGQPPFLLKRFADRDGVGLEFRQAGAVRTFALSRQQVVGFSSSHPQEQAPAAASSSQQLAVLASAIARLLPSDGQYRLIDAKVPLPTELNISLNLVLLEAMRRATEVVPVLQLIGPGAVFTKGIGSLPEKTALSPLENFVLEHLGEGKKLEELQALLPQEPQAIARAVAGLVCAGILVAGKALARPSPEKPLFPPANPELRARLARIAQEAHLPPMEVERELTPEELEEARRSKEEGLALLAQGDEKQALRLLTKAVSLSPDPQTLVRLAEVEVVNPLWRQRALAHLRQALEMDPKNTAAWLALANFWGLRGDLAKQRRCLENILKYDPQNREVQNALAHLR